MWGNGYSNLAIQVPVYQFKFFDKEFVGENGRVDNFVFAKANDVHKYLTDYAKESGIWPNIAFGVDIKEVSQDQTTKGWTI